MLTNGPQQQTYVRTNWQNAQIAPHVPNSSQHQAHIRTNWQECPNSTSAHRQSSQQSEPRGKHSRMGMLPVCTLVDLPGFGAPQLIPNASFHSAKKSLSWQPVPSRGETGRILKTNGLGSCSKRPHILYSGLASYEQQAGTPSWPHVPWESQDSLAP